jgi:hypothetical protein
MARKEGLGFKFEVHGYNGSDYKITTFVTDGPLMGRLNIKELSK